MAVRIRRQALQCCGCPSRKDPRDQRTLRLCLLIIALHAHVLSGVTPWKLLYNVNATSNGGSKRTDTRHTVGEIIYTIFAIGTILVICVTRRLGQVININARHGYIHVESVEHKFCVAPPPEEKMKPTTADRLCLGL